MTKIAKPYTPTPGTIPHLVIEHLQSLGPGVKLPTAALMEAVGHPEVKRINAYMEPAVRYGLVKTERVPNSRILLWALGEGAPAEPVVADDDTADLAGPMPTPNLAASSVFALAQQVSAAPAPTPAEGFRCALFNDGTLFIRSNGAEHTLPTEHTRALLRYLDALKPGEIDA